MGLNQSKFKNAYWGMKQEYLTKKLGNNIMNKSHKAILLDSSQINKTLTRLSHEIIEKNSNLKKNLFLFTGGDQIKI